MSSQGDFDTFTDEMFNFYRGGNYGAALELTERKEKDFPEQATRITFWRVCLLSRCGRTDDAIAALAKGLDEGLWWEESQFRDNDLDAIRDLPGFQDLVVKSHERWATEQKNIGADRAILVPAGSGPYPLLIVLHGHGGNKNTNLQYWEIARTKGWLVLSVQSRLASYPGAYYWETPQAGIEEILFHLKEIRRDHPIDAARIIVGGFSQGGGLAILAGLSPQVNAIGSFSMASWWENVDEISAAIQNGKPSRAYFVSGSKDHTLERSREIQLILKDSGIPVKEEVHPELGHEFPPDFEKSFENALNYLLP